MADKEFHLNLDNSRDSKDVKDDPKALEVLHERLDAIGAKISKSRSEAIGGRQNTGIEDEWLEDEEFYEGIDDANRGDLKAWRGKPLGSQGPINDRTKDTGSNIFLNITRRYVDTAAARMGDMLLPTDDRGWAIKPTPKPDLLALSDGDISEEIQQGINEDTSDPQQQQERADSAIADAKRIMNFARTGAKKAEKQIWDWHVETQYHKENRRVIEDAAKSGTGILKGPIPIKVTKTIFRDGKLQQIEEIKPASFRIFYRNLYPDPGCGENIHDGTFIFERDDISPAKLQRLNGIKGYVKSQITKLIKEGPRTATKDYTQDMVMPGLMEASVRKKTMFEIWYYYGSMRRRDLETISILSDKENVRREEDSDYDLIHVQVTMVNNRVIKASVSHIESGVFPYDVMVWQRRMGMPFGIGVARQVRPAQRIVVGALRHMMDNAGIAGGPMMYIDTEVLQAADGIEEAGPWKIYIPADGYEPGGTALKDAIGFIEAPMKQAELQAIIELGLRVAEDATGLPSILQGETNQRTPDTVGGMVLQNNNASTVLRRVAKLYDDLITEPHIRRYYDYILQYSKDDSMKGEFSIDALGSSALIERDTANQALMQIGDLIQNPIYKKDPVKWIDEVFKANKLDPARLDYDDEKWQKIVEGMAQQQQAPPDTSVEVANIKAEMEKVKIDAKAKVDGAIAKIGVEQDDKEMQIKLLLAQKGQELQIGLKQMSQELEIQLMQFKEQGLGVRQLNEIKQKIQDTVMKLQTQVSLNGTEAIKPPVEPKGRAPDGESFQK